MGSWCPECKGKTPKHRMFKKVYEYAENKNGKCLSEEYLNKEDPLEWKCSDNSHGSWSGSYMQIVERQKWCPQCS